MLKETRAAHRASATGAQLDSATAAAENARQQVERQQELLAGKRWTGPEKEARKRRDTSRISWTKPPRKEAWEKSNKPQSNWWSTRPNSLAAHQENLVAEAKVTLGPLVEGGWLTEAAGEVPTTTEPEKEDVDMANDPPKFEELRRSFDAHDACGSRCQFAGPRHPNVLQTPRRTTTARAN